MSLRKMMPIVLSMVAVLMLTATAAQTAWYVNDDADPGGDGLTAETAFQTIEAGITAAGSGDTVLVLDGTYTPVSIYGFAFAEKAITVCSQDGPDFCIIDGDGTTRGFNFYGEGSTSVLDGFTITNGSAGGGGGIACQYASPTIMNCVISNNSAGPHGGGIYCSNANPAITGCTIADNDAAAGGGIYCERANPIITDCTITGNDATGEWGGGGIALYSSSPTITNCTVSGNEAFYYGAGILVTQYWLGVDSSPTIVNCIISQNDATSGGGGIAVHKNQDMNVAFTGDPTIINCLIVGNTTTSTSRGGGGVFCDTGNTTITNCTFAGNDSSGTPHEGGGLLAYPDAVATLTNCILWDNLPDEIKSYSSSLTVTYSDVMDDNPNDEVVYPGTGNIDDNPLFADADLRLDLNSPCIDEGNDSAVTVATDLDGNDRIVGDAVDMGAYEFGGVVDSDNDGLSDADEEIYGTDPNDPDTDDDGLYDGTEVEMAEGTGCPDPLDPDSDGDSLLDGEEVEVELGTDPCNADTDADGIPDNIDPYPTQPEGNTGYVEQTLRDLAEYINGLDLDLFLGNNDNCKSGRRNSLANRANAAANNVAEAHYTGAIGVLNGLLGFIDGAAPPPDWMPECDERDYIRDTLNALITLLGYM